MAKIARAYTRTHAKRAHARACTRNTKIYIATTTLSASRAASYMNTTRRPPTSGHRYVLRLQRAGFPLGGVLNHIYL